MTLILKFIFNNTLHIFCLCKVFIIIGLTFFSSLLYSQNLKKADSLIFVYENMSAAAGENEKIELLREICVHHADPDIRLKYGNIALSIATKIDDPLWVLKIKVELANAYKKKGELQQALKLLYESLEYAEITANDMYKAVVYTTIGSVYKVGENYKQALEFYNKSVRLYRLAGDSVRLASGLLNTGELYRTTGQLDSALLYFKESGGIFDIKNYKIGTAYNIGNVGLVYASQGRHDLAEENINKAVAILETLGDSYAISIYDTYMADIYHERGDLSLALEYALRSYETAFKAGLKEQIHDASLKLSSLYADLNDYERAFTYQKTYLVYRDSINNAETIREMADLRTQYEIAKKQVEVDLLQMEQRNHRMWGIGLAAIILLLLVLAIMFYKNARQRQFTNKVLSEQKEEIEAQRDQLDDLNSSKDKFFSIISHDLRGPVHSFKGLSRLIKMYIEQNSIEELAELNVHFDNSVDQLSSLLDDLLDWAVSQQGQMPYDPQKVVLADVANEITGLFSNTARAKNIKLKTEMADIEVWADINSLRTILRNLTNNALKFTDVGGVVTIAAEIRSDKAYVSVSDTGRGMSQEQVQNLFKLAEHQRSWGTEGEKGLGLGLQLVQSFCELNKGSIEVQSKADVGTTFTISLPLYQVEAYEEA